MSIEEIIRLYNTENKVVFEGAATGLCKLSLEEIEENKNKALEEINLKSKEELIDFILKRDKLSLASVAING